MLFGIGTDCIFWAAVALGHYQMPDMINGEYWASYNTSYNRAPVTCTTPRARVKSILNKPTGHGYSVTYNYGLQPQPGRTSSYMSPGGASNSYGGRMK